MNSVTNDLDQNWKSIDWVLTDVDDTLTWQGQLPPETLVALKALRDAGKKVVAVTGACAGWCDHIAQLWPVDAVLGENGAFIMEKQNGYLTLRSQIAFARRRQSAISSQPQRTEVLDYSERLPRFAQFNARPVLSPM